MYEEAIKCLLNAAPYYYQSATGEVVQCRPSDITAALRNSAGIFYDVANASIPATAPGYFKKIDFTECDGTLKQRVLLLIFY